MYQLSVEDIEGRPEDHTDLPESGLKTNNLHGAFHKRNISVAASTVCDMTSAVMSLWIASHTEVNSIVEFRQEGLVAFPYW